MPEQTASELTAMCLRFEEAREKGESLTAEELCAGRPDLLPLLKQRLAALAALEPFGVAERWPATGGGGPTGGGPLGLPPGYEVTGELGRGGMGVVYRARQAALNRDVALKVVLGGGMASPLTRVRFLREAESLARLNHPNVVQVYEVGEAGGTLYFAMELVEGGPLAERLAGEPQAPRHAAEMAERLARGVQAAHAAGVVHRDLKPGNVLLTADGTPKITDFGLAKWLGDDDGHTRTGDIMGTPSYMAPEQAEGRREIGTAADVWALGVILYEMLTGRPPFKGATRLETMEQVRLREPVSPRALNPGVPRDLETITLKCLAKDPGRRYAGAGELADDLRRWIDGVPILARPAGPAERAWKWVARNPLPTALAAAVIAGLSAVLAVTLSYNAALGKEVKDRTRAEGDARREAEEKGKALGLARAREIELLAGNGRRAMEDGDVFAAARAALGVLKLMEDGPRREVERSRLGVLLRHAPRLTHVWRPPSMPRHVAVHGALVAATCEDGVIRVWEVGGGPAAELGGGKGPAATEAHFSPDGRTLYAACGANGVVAWDVRTGKEAARLAPVSDKEILAHLDELVRRGEVNKEGVERLLDSMQLGQVFPRGLRLSDDGGRMLAFDSAGAQVWDVATGKAAGPPIGHDDGLRRCPPALSADGRRVAVVVPAKDRGRSAAPYRIGVYLVDTGREAFAPLAYSASLEDAPRRLTFSADGKYLAAIGGNGLRVWSARTGAALPAVRGMGEAAVFTPDGKQLALFGMTGARVVAVPAGNETFTDGRLAALAGVDAMSPDGCLLASAVIREGVRVVNWRLDRLGSRLPPLPHPAEVSSLAWAEDARRLATAARDGVVRLWDLAGTVPNERSIEARGLHTHCAYSPDGRTLAAAVGGVRLWDAETGKERPALGERGLSMATVRFSADGRRLMAYTGMQGLAVGLGVSREKSGCVVWDVATGKRVGEPVLAAPSGKRPVVFFAAALSPDGRTVAHAADGGPVRRTAIDSGQPAGADLPLPGTIASLAFSPDGARLAASTSNGRLVVYDLAAGEEAWPAAAVEGGSARIAWSRDGKSLAASVIDDEKPAAFAWDGATGRPITPPIRHGARVHACELSPDGRRLLTAGQDGVVQVWDIAGARAALTLRLPGRVMHAAWSPDGRWIAATSTPGETRVWDADTGAPLGPALIHSREGFQMWLAFAPDSSRLAGCGDGHVLTWPLPREGRGVEALEAALAAFTGGDHSAARAACPPLFTASVADAEAFHRARVAEVREELEPSLPHFAALAALKKADQTLLVRLASACAARRRWAEGLRAADELLKVAPGMRGPTQWLRGALLEGMDRSGDALAAFDAALAAGYDDPSVHQGRGKALLSLGRWKEGDDALWKGLLAEKRGELVPLCVGALAARLAGRTPVYDRVCALLVKGVGPNTSDDQVAVLAATMAYGPPAGSEAGAVVLLARKALGSDPNDPSRLLALGLALTHDRKPAEAIPHLRRALAEGTPGGRVMARYALALAAHPAEATTWLGRAEEAGRALLASLPAGQTLPGVELAEIELLRREALARFRPPTKGR